MRKPAFVAVLAAAWIASTPLAQAQSPGVEIGTRVWFSSGRLKRSFNSQGVAPLLGNPSSVLTYDRLGAETLELFARKTLASGFFVRGNAGLGRGGKGSFRDEDFAAGQIEFSDSSSSVRGVRLSYATLDVGSELLTAEEGRPTLGVFGGLTQWRERADAYGASFHVNGLGAPDFPNSVPVVTNDVTWRALRAGFTGTGPLSERTKITADLAFIPYAEAKLEDSHWLRTSEADLGSAPNIHMRGRGHAGLQLDGEIRHAFGGGWQLGAGVRYWWLKANRGDNTQAGVFVPLVELESSRFGLTASLTRRW